MSAAGVWSREPTLAREASAMLTAFAHRAWPVQAHSCAPYLALAVASQPGSAILHVAESGSILAGDLRLHDPAGLAEALGVTPRTRPDAWLVLEAHRRWGADFAAKLLGDFAFALWDHAQRRLLLVRDSGGACPMFYTTRRAHLAFASHPRGLLCRPGFSGELNERAALDYLGEFPQEEEATLFAGIRRLPPGHLLIADEAHQRLERFFDAARISELPTTDDDTYARSLRSVLALAVDCRLPESRRLAVMLSGGLDSSAIAALAATTSSPRKPLLDTISAVFPDAPECDERPYQAALVSTLGTRHHEIRPAPTGEAAEFARLCRVFSDPSFIGPHWIAWGACELAVTEGATSMMTGIDGDRVVSHGAGRFGDLVSAGDFRGLVRELGAVHDFDLSRRVRVGAAQLGSALLPARLLRALDRVDPRSFALTRARTRFFRGEALRRHDVAERLRAEPRRARSTREEHLRSLQAPDRNGDVELLEQLGTAFNLRFEQPFFDRRVVELCVALPGSQKRQQGWARYVLRRAMCGLVPESILERRVDASFDRPYWAWTRRWLLEQGGSMIN